MKLVLNKEYAVSYQKILVLLSIVFFVTDALIFNVSSSPLYVLNYFVFFVFVLLSCRLGNLLLLFLLVFLFAKGLLYTSTLYDLTYFISFASIVLFDSRCLKVMSGILSKEYLKFLIVILFFLFSLTFIGVDNVPETVGLSQGGEYARNYNSGAFRSAHIASYTMLFIFVISFCELLYRRSLFFLFSLVISLWFMLYTGTRTSVYALAFALLFSNIKLNLRSSFLLVAALISMSMVIVNIQTFLKASEGMFLYQYFSFIDTAINNFERLSRVQLFESFYSSVSGFSFFEILFGTSFYSQNMVNYQNIGLKIWFHNDWLSIFHSYGVIGTMIFIYALKRWYSLFSSHNNNIMKVIFFCILFMSITNGIIMHPMFFYLGLIFSFRYQGILK